MGFDTYLKIDGSVVLLWRKHAGALPRLLFRHDNLVVVEDVDETGTVMHVAYRASVREVLATLEASGLGWHATVAAYAETRIPGTSEGMVMGKGLSEGASHEEIEQRVADFRALPPDSDLEALGRFLAYRWNDPEVEEVEILKEIIYDSEIQNISQVSIEVFRVAANIEGIDAISATRATESWCVLYREAPLLAWPMLMCIFLQYLDSDSIVTFDISEAVFENGDMTLESARTYADDYWRWTSEYLASTARTIGRLFGVLASFDSNLGREFWFARSADLHGKLLALADVADGVTTKVTGDLLEALMEALLRTEEPELQVVERNFRTREEEIDLLLTNGLRDPFWIAHGSPLVFVECKNNRQAKPGVPELRIFESKIKDRGALCRIGIFVSMSGFAGTFLQRLKTFQSSDGVIFAVSGDDLGQLIASKTRLTEWLRGPGVLRSLGK
jgi:hypothetical protein